MLDSPTINEAIAGIIRGASRTVKCTLNTVADSAFASLMPIVDIEREQTGAPALLDPCIQLWIAQAVGHVNSFATDKQAYLDRVEAFFGEHLH